MTLPRIDVAEGLSPQQTANVAAGFQKSIVDVLVRKTVTGAEDRAVQSVAVVGGVAANRALRAAMEAAIDVPLYLSPPSLATDNAAMIAAAAYFVPREMDEPDVKPDLELAPRRSERV